MNKMSKMSSHQRTLLFSLCRNSNLTLSLDDLQRDKLHILIDHPEYKINYMCITSSLLLLNHRQYIMANKRKNINISTTSTPKRRIKKYSAREATILCTADPNSSPENTCSPILPSSVVESSFRTQTSLSTPERLFEEQDNTTNGLLGRILEVLLRIEEKVTNNCSKADNRNPSDLDSVVILKQPLIESINGTEQNISGTEQPPAPVVMQQLAENLIINDLLEDSKRNQSALKKNLPAQRLTKNAEHEVLECSPPERPIIEQHSIQEEHLQQVRLHLNENSSNEELPEAHKQKHDVPNDPTQELPIVEDVNLKEHQLQQQIPLPTISEERIRKLRSTSYKPSSFAIALSREYYTQAERSKRCCLRGKKASSCTLEIPSISPSGRRLQKICDTTFRVFGIPDGDKGSTRRQIIRAIDSANRYVRGRNQ